MTLSGGMKRRVMIAKALVARAADPVPRRADRRASTWSCARTCGRSCARLRDSGVTIILTTHYIDEAEEMADRVGVITKGELILVEDKAELMRKLGKKQLTLQLQSRSARARPSSTATRSSCRPTARELIYTYDTKAERTGITALLNDLDRAGVGFKRPADQPKLARGHLRQPGEASAT